MSRDTPSNSDDVIDSRDVIRAIRDLEDEREQLADAVTEAEDAFRELVGVSYSDATAEQIDENDAEDAESTLLAARAALQEWDEDEDQGGALKALRDLEGEAEGYSDWRHGATLIRDSYFEDYARQTAEDIHGRGVADASWPFDCIDWEKAADALKQDYTCVDFDGVEYWVRS